MSAAPGAPFCPAAIRALLRSPDGRPLLDGEAALCTAEGQIYPVRDGMLWLLPAEARNSDQGDGHFYDSYPFGARDWTDPAAIDAGVETELRQILAQLPLESLILDVGAGAGRISNYIGSRGFSRCVSLDLSLVSLRQVHAHSDNVCVWGDNLQLPFADGAFDLVISSGVAHHTPEPHRAVAECARVLAPGGRLYLRVYNRHSPYYFLHGTYGAWLRHHEASRTGQAWARRCGFGFYTWARRNVLRRGDADVHQLRAKFGNLFLKPLVYFFTAREVDRLLAHHGLVVESFAQQGATHRMLNYVACKPA